MATISSLRSFQLILTLYVLCATIFTTNILLASTINLALPQQSLIWPSWPRSPPWILDSRGQQAVAPRQVDNGERTLQWNSTTGPIRIHENLFFSKAFSNSLHPSTIIPFFFRANSTPADRSITITTLITRNRFPVFAKLVERYQGPISVTIHVKNETSTLRRLLADIHTLYSSSPAMARHVDVHLIIDSFDRQFNMWRNIARFFARTDFVMMLDIDFSLCTDFHTTMMRPTVMEKLRLGYSAFVIPAFEYSSHSEGMDDARFPRHKTALLPLIQAKKIRPFHASWGLGHNSTDYDRYYSAKPGEIYKVTDYQAAYEPYVVFKKEGPPWCDERFVGYGGNKAACLFEMYLSGISFYVLSDHFIIHQNHPYQENTRKNERKFNRKVYSDFKEETCLKYLMSYHQSGLLDTTRGLNVQTECRKMKGVVRTAIQSLGNTP